MTKVITISRPEVKPTRNRPHFNRPFGEGVFAKRSTFTSSDAQWWAENSPTRDDNYEVVANPRRWDRLAAEAETQSRLEVALAW